MATVQATPAHVRAGEEVVVSGIRFIGFGPVTIRLNSLDGPVLATAPMGPGANSVFRATVTIPPETPPGQVVLIAMQDPEPGGSVPWGVPARTVVDVTNAAGIFPAPFPPDPVIRPADLTRDSVSTGAFVVVGLGVAAAALLVAGALALAAGRKGAAAPAPEEIR
ncbi:MAG: hypothetical protein ACRD1D_15945 [Acidimicrobiales bacterium]